MDFAHIADDAALMYLNTVAQSLQGMALVAELCGQFFAASLVSVRTSQTLCASGFSSTHACRGQCGIRRMKVHVILAC